MFKNDSIKGSYIAICDNFLTDKKLRINLPIGLDPKNPQKRKVTNIKAKEAITNVELIKTFYHERQPKCLVKCNLETGRTHQIRVHLAHINNPIYGDNVYNKKID
ncbi:pseudouridine synthase, partial [Mycoplasmopsis synoviae]